MEILGSQSCRGRGFLITTLTLNQWDSTTLPAAIGEWCAEEARLANCSSLVSLPDSIRQARPDSAQLVARAFELPDAIGGLGALKQLNPDALSLEKLPDVISEQRIDNRSNNLVPVP